MLAVFAGAGNSLGLAAVPIDRQLLSPPCDLHEFLWLSISHELKTVWASISAHSETFHVSSARSRLISASLFERQYIRDRLWVWFVHTAENNKR